MRLLGVVLFISVCLSANAQYLYLDMKQSTNKSFDLNEIGAMTLLDSALVIKKQTNSDTIPLTSINKLYYNLNVTEVAKIWLESENSITIYPNPCVERVNFNFTLSEDAKVFSEVIDVNGKVILQHLKGTEFSKGGVQISLSLPNGINAGTYFYVATVNSVIYAQPFIISQTK